MSKTSVSRENGFHPSGVKYLSQKEAQKLDEELMGPTVGYSVDQLMELAGLSVASAIVRQYPPPPPADESASSSPSSSAAAAAGGAVRDVVVVCGPGNNGGDGIVAARHLRLFGYRPRIVYPKRPDKELYTRLVRQAETCGVPVLDALPQPLTADLIVDAVFGFSFSGEIRAPFDRVLETLRKSSVPIVSVDVPSGWSVDGEEEGDDGKEEKLRPAMLVSLSAPKLCARRFKGSHYLGGRFIPPQIEKKYELRLPKFEGDAQVVKLQ